MRHLLYNLTLIVCLIAKYLGFIIDLALSLELESTPFKLYLLVATDVALAFNATSAVVKKKMLDTVQFGHIYMNDPIPSLYLPAI
jgi:hypothetical protein